MSLSPVFNTDVAKQYFSLSFYYSKINFYYCTKSPKNRSFVQCSYSC
jgi:hypothetical protein